MPANLANWYLTIRTRKTMQMLATSSVVLVNRFERTAHGEVVFEILVEKDVPAALGSLGQVIDPVSYTHLAFGFHLVGKCGAEVLQPLAVLPAVE